MSGHLKGGNQPEPVLFMSIGVNSLVASLPLGGLGGRGKTIILSRLPRAVSNIRQEKGFAGGLRTGRAVSVQNVERFAAMSSRRGKLVAFSRNTKDIANVIKGSY